MITIVIEIAHKISMSKRKINYIANALSISESQVQNTIQLFDEGATIPFIARYRKEKTGSLDEVQISDLKDLNQKFIDADKRRDAIIKSIEEQGKMTPELLLKINNALFVNELEDIYLPYKQKRKTKATIAIEKGLEPFAKIIFAQADRNIEKIAEKYLNDKVLTIQDALQGARDIMAEWINESIDARLIVRRIFEREAIISAKIKKGKNTEAQKFLDYFDFSESLSKIPSHRLLAIRRGEEEGFLSIEITPESERAIDGLERLFLKGLTEPKEQVAIAIEDSYKRLLKPSIETEFDNSSKEKADIEAIKIFRENLTQLLLSAPLGQKNVLGLDPGYRTGCKIVCLNKQGTLLHDGVIFPFDKRNEAELTIKGLVDKYKIEAIAIGNGTASRDSEDFIKKLNLENVKVFIVSEQGASIYSASTVAREEFPNKDVTVRGAISIARRLMDPLAELVKIDAKSIGVGQYQHDVDQKMLKNGLDATVESCVNLVGVELNTASKHLLSYVSGLGPVLAQNIVDFRTQNGPFKTRNELKKVPRLGEKAFEQAAGFLRIHGATNPLDNSGVHPESYDLVSKMALDLNSNVQQLIINEPLRKSIEPKKYISEKFGLPTINDIIKELSKPGRDPRDVIEEFSFAHDIKTIEDLVPEMILPGIVTNITAFGCFVDVGVKQDGLLHVSQMSNKFIKDPNEIVKVHQKVKVKVVEVDVNRKRIAFTMKF